MALALTRSSIAQCLPSTLTRRLYVRLLLREFRFFVFVISATDRKNITEVLTEVTRHLPKETGSVFVILSFLDTDKVLHHSQIIISF